MPGDFVSVLQDFTPAAIVIHDGRMNMGQDLAYVSCCGFDSYTRAGMDFRISILSLRFCCGISFSEI